MPHATLLYLTTSSAGSQQCVGLNAAWMCWTSQKMITLHATHAIWRVQPKQVNQLSCSFCTLATPSYLCARRRPPAGQLGRHQASCPGVRCLQRRDPCGCLQLDRLPRRGTRRAGRALAHTAGAAQQLRCSNLYSFCTPRATTSVWSLPEMVCSARVFVESFLVWQQWHTWHQSASAHLRQNSAVRDWTQAC